MNIQEQEELDFFPATEAQNCLSEAVAYAAERTEVRRVGSGPYIIRVQYPVYCRATDGFAGMVTVEVRRFETSDEGKQWWADKGDAEDRDEDIVHIFEGKYADDARAMWAPAEDADEIPF